MTTTFAYQSEIRLVIYTQNA